MGETAGRAGSRRGLLQLGAAALTVGAVWQGWPRLMALLPRRLAFEPLDDPPGFRRIAGGRVSGGFDPLAGIGGAAPSDRIGADNLRGNLCAALFGPGRPGEGVVPVAFFTDYRCPFCRVLTPRLAALAGQCGIAVRWHEWPLLGPDSEAAARLALAADRQGAYARLHSAMMSGFVPTPGFVDAVAARLGLDAARLRADSQGAAVTARLAETRALARLFGFAGTPALVVGRTVVVGVVDEATLAALVAQERAEGPPPGCG